MYTINENSHPNVSSPSGKQRRRYDAPCNPSETSQQFKDGMFVDSVDAAEIDLGRQPISEVGKSAGASQASKLLSTGIHASTSSVSV